MYPGSLFIDGIDFWNFWKNPVDYYYKALDISKWDLSNTTKPACKCNNNKVLDTPVIEENDNELTIRFKGMKDADSGQMSFDGDRTFEVSFERGNGNETTKMSVKTYIPEKYEIEHEERMEGDDIVFVWSRKNENKFKDIKCEEHECNKTCTCDSNKREYCGLKRTLKWMEKELSEAMEIGDNELCEYLSGQIPKLKTLLGENKIGKEIRYGKHKMILDNEGRISRN